MPPFLSYQDKIEIIAPSKFVFKKDMLAAVRTIESYGFVVQFNDKLFLKKDVFSGNKKQRIHNFQSALNNKETKAIFFARGGYGAIQIIDHIDFTDFKKNPKWLIGFSDIAIILMHLYSNYNVNSIHGPMPFNFQYTNKISIKRLFNMLKGKVNQIQIKHHEFNNLGSSCGLIIGGNLSILCSLIGSTSFIDLNKDHILFIEDVDEYLYRLERMIYVLERAGIFKKIKGLIIGQFTKSLDNQIQFGKTPYQIIYSIVSKYNYPIAFNFPIGHGSTNYPIIIGSEVQLDVNSSYSKLEFT